MNLRYYVPLYQDGKAATGGQPLAFLSNIYIPDPTGSASLTEIFIGNNVTAQQWRSDAAVDMIWTGDGLDLATGLLGETDNGFLAGLAVNSEQVNGGAIGTLAPGLNINVFGPRSNFDGDVILHDYPANDGGEMGISNVYVGSGSPGIQAFDGHITVSTGSGYGTPPVVYGGGKFEALFGSVLSYPSGATGATGSLKLSGGIQLNDVALGCLGIASYDAGLLGCNVPTTVANLDSLLGSVQGCLFVPGGSSVCNFNE